MPTLAVAAPSTRPEAPVRSLHCAGCGRRLLDYAALGTATTIRVKCRDCKALTELHGADVPTLLTTLAETKGGDHHGREVS